MIAAFPSQDGEEQNPAYFTAVVFIDTIPGARMRGTVAFRGGWCFFSGFKMSKIAILSDIHGNADALKSVLALCGELGVDSYASLGDIVGYNAEPLQCLRMVRALKPVAMVRGNHDDYTASTDEEMEGFNTNAKRAILWTRSQLSEAERRWVGEPPLRMAIPGMPITLVHATLDSPDTWGYVFDVYHAVDNFSYQLTQICFCGHSHVPVAFCKRPFAAGPLRGTEEVPDWINVGGARPSNFGVMSSFQIQIEPGCKYLFNIGSIGQPRNRDPRASFAIYNDVERTVTRYALPYDIAEAQRKVLEAGLPERLAVRLGLGE